MLGPDDLSDDDLMLLESAASGPGLSEEHHIGNLENFQCPPDRADHEDDERRSKQLLHCQIFGFPKDEGRVLSHRRRSVSSSSALLLSPPPRGFAAPSGMRSGTSSPAMMINTPTMNCTSAPETPNTRVSNSPYVPFASTGGRRLLSAETVQTTPGPDRTRTGPMGLRSSGGDDTRGDGFREFCSPVVSTPGVRRSLFGSATEPLSQPEPDSIFGRDDSGAFPNFSAPAAPHPASILAHPLEPPPWAPLPGEGVVENFQYFRPDVRRVPKRERRFISATAYKILDAPAFVDDFYLHLLDWGASDLLAVALGELVYIWNARSGTVQRLAGFPQGQTVTSVAFNGSGDRVAVGIQAGAVHVFDAATQRHLGMTVNHKARVAGLSFRGGLLASGGADKRVCACDTRIHCGPVTHFTAHTEEVCTLKWSYCGQFLASSGADGRALVWSLARPTRPLHTFSHSGAVKGMAWSPHTSGLLATAGGRQDGVIKVHSMPTGRLVSSTPTRSQVCDLVWDPAVDEIATSHGESNNGPPVQNNGQQPQQERRNGVEVTSNSIALWRCGKSSLRPIATLNGHIQRVLHLTLSPDGTRLASGSPDETVRLWEAFPKAAAKPQKLWGEDSFLFLR
eukprot:Hpha_TRINITY_DN8609_c0_g1::TRINITY_DN8609_c0_g1_i1::g.168876::m.168876/K03364/CDH1; cell division cycle 20-like protein 1, cofactor of APC complex